MSEFPFTQHGGSIELAYLNVELRALEKEYPGILERIDDMDGFPIGAPFTPEKYGAMVQRWKTAIEIIRETGNKYKWGRINESNTFRPYGKRSDCSQCS